MFLTGETVINVSVPNSRWASYSSFHDQSGERNLRRESARESVSYNVGSSIHGPALVPAVRQRLVHQI